MFKYQSGDLPKLFDNMFTLNSSVHSYNTRQCNMYHQPKVFSTLALNSFRINCIKEWNDLDSSIQQSTTLSKFKVMCKKKYFNDILMSIHNE